MFSYLMVSLAFACLAVWSANYRPKPTTRVTPKQPRVRDNPSPEERARRRRWEQPRF